MHGTELCVVVCLLLVGCGDSTQRSSNQASKDSVRTAVNIGVAYPHTLFVHCGVLGTTFAGRDWDADPPLSDGSGNPPQAWAENTEEGTMTLESSERAIFKSKSGDKTATFTPRLANSPDPNENCE
jgi:hypothetical protein